MMKRYVGVALLCGAAGFLVSGAAQAAVGVAPPAMYPAATWQGQSQAVLRVLDRLDGHLELLTVPVGGSATYRSLAVAVEACVTRPQTLATDAGVLLHLKDSSDPQRPSFDGWMLAQEPSVATYGSPLYDVRVVSCAGVPTAPQAGPLPVVKAPVLAGAEVPVEEGGDAPASPPGSPSGGPVPLAPDSHNPIPLAPTSGAVPSLAPAAPAQSSGQPLPPPQADPGLE
ncbi:MULTISPECIES: DUF2155 domain-containing protein [Gluconobacter]|uniref:DUF2155 domain-containing protein n=1 Tax=Gluconobacter cadivus TaxID=2728101 RepID=A0ABR9YX92_9PROT|nr:MULTISPECIES: DUF2155 domain-containing protein [Gluconobacter]MBF0889165.1 DUF2155 domain-containing protein [Gluconobacter cadivus]MBS1061080.1 DUF2155 domain-containing protein [Gluconobacter sp. Dm-44]